MRASAILLLLLIARPLSAVTLTATTVGPVNPGGPATVCVALGTDGAEVAGTQNDLVWDGNCLTLPDASTCHATGTHSKQLQGKLLGNRDFTYRALILSLSDVDPIADGVLYCCDFILETTTNECCTVDVTGAGASDSKGNAVVVLAIDGEVCAGPVPEISFTPTFAATPTATPTPSSVPQATASPTATRTPTQCSGCFPVSNDEDDGCQVAAPAAGNGAAWPLAVAAALAVLRRRRR